MEIENSRDFGIFGVFGGCLELQRGQVVVGNSKIKNICKKNIVYE